MLPLAPNAFHPGVHVTLKVKKNGHSPQDGFNWLDDVRDDVDDVDDVDDEYLR